MRKRVIFINRFYQPDHSATSQILTDLTAKLIISQADVHVITSRLYYSDSDDVLPAEEELGGVFVHRA